jgi:recombination protein RecA
MASDPIYEITRIPFGILSVDILLGGGAARGRHIELFGGYSVGKTALTYYLIACCQRRGGRAAFIDAEGSFDPKFAASLGVDIDALAIHRQEHGNRVIDFMETLIRSGLFDVIVLDSIAALLPKSELESDMEGGSYGTAQAKLMSAAMRRLTTANKATEGHPGAVLCYINQTRDSIGSIFQKKAVTSGGRAMGFYAGTRLELVRVENIKRATKGVDPKTGADTKQQIVCGHRVLLRAEKDKTGGAIQQAQTTFVFDYDLGGIDNVEDLMYLGRTTGLVRKSGNSWWIAGYEDDKQLGRNRFKRWLRADALLCEELTENIQAAASGSTITMEEDEDDDS